MYDRIQLLSRNIEEYVTLILSFLINRVLYRKKDLTPANIRRIAVIKLDHIGDVILSIPAIINLRINFPQAHISIVVNPSSEPIARFIPGVDEIICYNARFFDRSGKSKMLDFPKGIKFAKQMRAEKYDLIVEFRGGFASLLFAMFGDSRYRLDRGTYLVLRKLKRIASKSEHEAEVNLGILVRGGIPIKTRELRLELAEKDLNYANSVIGGISNKKIVIHPGTPVDLKCWSFEKFTQLIHRLSEEYKASVILVGGKNEKQIAESIELSTNGHIINLTGKTTFGQLAAIMSKADYFVGNDSGPMHVASACGINVIGLFGPTSPQRFGPYGRNCLALRMEADCPPCMKTECRRSPDYRCIDNISVDHVMQAISKL
jgi:lipopolysaccharide heptosyltransferase II